MGDQQPQPLFTLKAHVFQIDPETKKTWVPVSPQSLSISFYHDVARNAYRIISMDGSKIAINSTITATMVFAKTSQKFGQWADARAATVYGLGFTNEADLTKFVEKFNELKERVQDVPPSVTPPQHQPPPQHQTPPQHQPPLQQQQHPPPPKPEPGRLIGNGAFADESKTVEQLKRENKDLKDSLLESKNSAKLWEGELQTLRNNNARLTAALQESTVNLDQWRKQLEMYKDECAALRNKLSEQESRRGDVDRIQRQLTESQEKLREAENLAQLKQDELSLVTKRYEEARQTEAKYQKLNSTLQVAEDEGRKLRAQVTELQLQLSQSQSSRSTNKQQLEKLQQQLSTKINEIYEMNDRLADLLQATL